VDADDLQETRRRVKTIAADVYATCRAALKPSLAEAVLCGGVYGGARQCATCNKPAAAGKRLRVCGGCKEISYCNIECRDAHYPIHKTMCSEWAISGEEAEAKGIDMSKRDDVIEWYRSCGMLEIATECLAWQYRKESPCVFVQGGVNARMAKIGAFALRSQWGAIAPPSPDPLELAPLFDAANFNADTDFLVHIKAYHPGTENWPEITTHFLFPWPPDEMDAWVERTTQQNPDMLGGFGIQAPRAEADARPDVAPPPPRKQKPNEPCCCGSGKKFKKCCHNK
jgi:hypothetical protein